MNDFSGLSLDLVRDLWSKTYNTDGKPDWSHIFKYYHSDIVFQDSIQRIEGIKPFQEMCNRLTKRTHQLRFEIVHIVQDENIILFDWVMTMVFKKSPSTPIYGSTTLTLSDEGLILRQRDYYDLWGDIFNQIPHFKRLYRRFMTKKFG